jgi:hypothetical protein
MFVSPGAGLKRETRRKSLGNGGLQFVAPGIPKQSEADEKRPGLQIGSQ